MSDEVMAAPSPMEFSLKYCFDIADIRDLQPGDVVSSSCPPTDTMHKGRSVVYSPGGFPLHFSFHLIYQKRVPGPKSPSHRFLLQLALELQPIDVPYVHPFHIQPLSIPSDQVRRPMHMDGRLLGPLQAELWGFRWLDLKPWPPATLSAVGELELGGGWELPGPSSPWTGEFRFQLLDDDPPPSEAEWSCLPPDMISAVLRELPLADRVSARLVCQTWSRILDTDSLCWSNVIFVRSIGRKMDTLREVVVEPYSYNHPEGRVNQVQHHNLYEALGFLTSRKATIRSLELNQDPSLSLDPYYGLKHLSTELSQRNIKLKALLFRSRASLDHEQNEAVAAAFFQLLQSQPSLERLHLRSVSIPIQSLRQALPQLSILCFHIRSEGDWETFQAQASQLSGLHGFRLAFTYYFPDSADLANMSSIVESGNSLRRVKGIRRREWPNGCQSMYCGCCLGCGYAAVWGTERLSPAAAAFLLMPVHEDSVAGMLSSFEHHRF